MPDDSGLCKSRGAAGANDRAEDGARRSQVEKWEAPVNLRRRKAKALQQQNRRVDDVRSEPASTQSLRLGAMAERNLQPSWLIRQGENAARRI
jgi:hypothetical protein